MDVTLLGIRLLLAVVFAAAGVGKLRDRRGFLETLPGFGVPAGAAPALATLVPVAELLAAVLLLASPTAGPGAALGLALLAVFTVAVAVSLARGRAPDCRCFGGAEATPVGPITLVRNVALGACAAALLAVGTGAGILDVLARWAAAPGERVSLVAHLATVAALGGLAWIAARQHERSAGLVRQVAALERQLASATAAIAGIDMGLPVGAPAPDFDLPLLAGDRATLATLTAGGVPVMLVFSSAHCPSCAELWRDIGRWQQQLGRTLKVVVVGTGTATALEAKLFGTGVRDAVLAGESGLADTYRVAGIPSAVIVAPERTIDSATVMGPAAVRALVAERTSGPGR